MNAITPQIHLLILWTTVTVVALLGLIAVLVWAVRTRQFSNQDRARYLPLESGIPENETETSAAESGDKKRKNNEN